MINNMINQFSDNNGAAKFILSVPTHEELTCLKEFIYEFGGSLDPNFWSGMVLEEALEVEEAFDDDDFVNVAKELADMRYTMIGMFLSMSDHTFEMLNAEEHPFRENLALASVAASRMIKEAGTLYEADVLEEVFFRVHESNMTKLGRDGKPVRNDIGKVMKGPDYMPPYLEDIITIEIEEVEQMKEAA